MSAPDPSSRRGPGEARAILRLAGPLVFNNLALAGMNFADTVMAGRLGTRDLAAVAVGGSIWMVVFLFGLGVLMAVSPVVAHAYGAGRWEDAGVALRQAFWLSQALAVLGFTALLGAPALLAAMGIDPEVVPLTGGYLFAISFGLPGVFAFLAMRFMTEGIGWTRPIMYAAAVGLVVNVSGNWVLMYGNLGFPRLGAVGCGIASAVAMWCMFATMLWYTRRSRRYERFVLWRGFERPRWPVQREILGLGLPIAASVEAEAGLFAGVALIMGTLGATQVAAHQIAINYAATMFMVPLAFHSATTIRVGQALGRGEPRRARRAGWSGIGLCGLFMVASATVLLFFREQIAAFYTTDPELLPLAVALLSMAMIFQVSDGLQVGAAGALRGFKDTRVPMLINVASYWLIAFPMAWYAGVHARLGPTAVWVALIIGLTVTALLLNFRFLRLANRRVAEAAAGQAVAGRPAG
ncbi:MATE family efflux transporter [Thioalkalivibrio sp. XN8]|uniref:MATE family efflux transporter n=1 Tax=Thioalkalivibrio sp. XN8 TaxID=2712863 RepID=UPI0013EBFD8B|nr:MATE family efflux transporter [Thioalkalivibrio sp. XN8]